MLLPSRPVQPSEVKSLIRDAAATLGFAGCADEASTDPARLFYLPSCPPDRVAQAESRIVDGDCLDVDAMLRAAGAAPSADSSAIGTAGAVAASDGLPSSLEQPPERKRWRPEQVARLLRLINPDQEYDHWFRTLAAVHFELGPEDGRAAAHDWCSRGGKYQGERDFDSHWCSLGKGAGGLFSTGTHLLREAYPDGLPSWDHIGNARRIDRHHAGELMRVAETGQWFRWSGARWRASSVPEVEDLGRAVVEDMPADSFLYPDPDRQKKYLTWCAKSAMRAWVPALETLGAMPGVLATAADLDNHAHLFGVRNGAVDLRTGRLLPPDPALRLTMCAGAEFDPQATCPTFERVLSDVFFDDPAMVSFFRRALGYTLLASPREELIFIPHGLGANGKSKIFEAVCAALGDYAKTCAAETLLDAGSLAGGGGGAREDLVRLRGARLLVTSEPEEGARLRESLVKSMSGGDRITARAPYAKASIEITPTWVTWMPTNHKPVVRGDDNGIWRRLCLIPFERNFKDDPHIKADPQLADKLRAELPGILALLVRAAGEYLRDGLDMPQKVREASEGYRSEMDLLATWIEESCEVGTRFEAATGELWRSWRAFATDRGLDRYIPTETAFGRRMQQRFPLRRTNTARYRIGIRLRDPFAASTGEIAQLQLLQGGKT
ncbi:MAG: PriCT-2 domain-containing protein [Proteobacteria bacterium]|nr:PriCT-2 domain-containing protein [Pseudomonadota bacterium]MBS0495156.1 PriCT-2 domain-containing protein [Pseudomonadota bacterium]